MRLELQSDAGDAQIIVGDGHALGLRRLDATRSTRRTIGTHRPTAAGASTATRRAEHAPRSPRALDAARTAGDALGRPADDAGRPARLQGQRHAQARRGPARPGRDRLGCRARHAAAHLARGGRQQLARARPRRHRHQLRQRRPERARRSRRPRARRSSTSARSTHAGAAARRAAARRRACAPVQAAVPFTLAAPDTLVGLPAHGRAPDQRRQGARPRS